MPDEYEGLRLDVDGPVATITLDDPESLNALSFAMASSLVQVLGRLSGDGSGIRAAIITGAGRGFCSGLNLRAPRPTDPTLTAMEAIFVPLVHRLLDTPFPLVAAVNGPCAGIGVTIAVMCDHLVAARSSYLVLPFTSNLAVIGDAGITWVLPRLVGLSRARRMLLFNEKVRAQTALEWGLADRVCDDGETLTSAVQAAQQLAAGPTRALAGVRRALWQGLQHDYERHLIYEIELNRPLFDSDDYREAKQAIVERRPPRFSGR